MQTILPLNPPREVVVDFAAKIRAAGEVAFDIETNGLDPFKNDILMMQFGLRSGEVLILSHGYDIPKELWDSLRSTIVIGHNLKFDEKFIQYHYNRGLNQVWDVLIMEASLNLGRRVRVGLEHVAKRRIGLDMQKDIRRNFIGRPVENLTFTREEIEYGARDVIALYPLMDQQQEEMYEHGLWKPKSEQKPGEVTVADLENDTVLTTAAMELHGMEFDAKVIQDLLDEYEPKLLAVVEDIYERLPGGSLVQTGWFSDTSTLIDDYVDAMGLNSTKSVLAIFEMLGYDLENTESFTLKQIREECWFAEAMLEYRKLNKMVTTYLRPLLEAVHPVTGRAHFSYSQLHLWDEGASTGRYSCKRFHQIPAKNFLRMAFVAPKGYKVITADYSNVELRIAAILSKDPRMIDFFNGVEKVKIYKVTGAGETKYFRFVEDGKKEARARQDANPDANVRLRSVYVPVTDYHGYMASFTFNIPMVEAVNIEIDGQELPTCFPELRAKQKTLNFASIYLVTMYGIRTQLNNPYPETLRRIIKVENADQLPIEELAEMATPAQLEEAQLQEAAEMLESFGRAVPRLMGALKSFGQFAVRNFYITDQSIGRIRWFDHAVPDWKREKAGANMPVQGTSASQMKLALNLIRKRLPDAIVVGTVHDEVIVYVPEDEAEWYAEQIREIMIEAANAILSGPVSWEVGVKIADHWIK